MNGVVNFYDKNYPALLKSIPDPPKKFYWKGTYNESIFANCLSIVGSRKMSPYGERVVEKIVREVSLGVTVVSGFMYGVDTKAHIEALKRGLKTVAVLPCGLDFIYPKSNNLLYKQIVDYGGLLVSEYEGSAGPRTWSYLRRNRIVAGLGKALLVVEASEKSGSLNTAELMRSYGRPVLAVPGNIFSELSLGCLKLLKTYAKPVSSGYEVNEFLGVGTLGMNLNTVSSESHVLKKDDTIIVNILKSYPLTLDDLSSYLSMPISILSSKVTQLCLNGVLVENCGRFYAR